jgi:hypothetical protein
MEISRINSGSSFAFPVPEKENTVSSAAPSQDVVDIRSMNLLDDDEVDGVLSDTIGMISQDSVGALSVHGGLTASRVASLLSV